MYFYYFLTACGIRPKWAGFVTSIQIIQMVIGMLITFVHYYILQFTDWTCAGSVQNLHFCFVMYLSYFLLFMQFAIRRYFSKRSGEGKKEKVEMQQKDIAEVVREAPHTLKLRKKVS